MKRMSREPWSKRRFLLTYWLVQGVVTYVGWPQLIEPRGWPAMFDVIWDAQYLTGMGTVLGLIMAVQAFLLLPVRRPDSAPETRGARWSRHALGGLAAGAVALGLGLVFVGVMALADKTDWLHGWADRSWSALIPPAVVAPPVTLFLAWRYRSGTPVLLSVLIAGGLAAALPVGLVFASLSFANEILAPAGFVRGGGWLSASEPWGAWLIAVFCIGWIAATPLLLAFVRRNDRESAMARIASRLFLGTMIEVAALIPMDVMIRRKTNCYCGAGTLWALTICWGVGTLVLGPAIWLVPLARRRRRLVGRCEVCDYDMTGCPDAERCPECGTGWRSGPPAARR